MIIKVKVKPGAKEDKIEKISDNEYNVSLRAKPEGGEANISLVKMLSKHFNVPFQDVSIKNKTSRHKMIIIKDKLNTFKG